MAVGGEVRIPAEKRHCWAKPAVSPAAELKNIQAYETLSLPGSRETLNSVEKLSLQSENSSPIQVS